jgi:hypothetical protein
MKQIKVVALTLLAVLVLASATVVSAQGPIHPAGRPPQGPPPQGTPPSGTPPAGTPPAGQLARNNWVGVVQTVSTTSMTVLNSANETFTVTIGSSTKVELMVSRTTGSVSDIQVGNNVSVEGAKASDGSVTATRIMVEPSGSKAAGAVSAVSGSTITITAMGGTTSTIVTTTDTKFYKGTTAASLSDVTKGVFVMAYGTKASDGSITATYVFVETGPSQRGQGMGMPQPGR